MQRSVVPGVVAKLPPKPKKHKEHLTIGESFTFLAKSPYIRDLAALVGARASQCLPEKQSFRATKMGLVHLKHRRLLACLEVKHSFRNMRNIGLKLGAFNGGSLAS